MAKFLTQILGDRQRPRHRSALEGNAMLFNEQRWVRLTAGLDTIPQLLDIPITYIAVFRPNRIDGDGNVHTIVSQNNNLFTNVLGRDGREERLSFRNNQFFLNRTINNTVQRVHFIDDTNMLNNKYVAIFNALATNTNQIQPYPRGRFVASTSATSPTANKNNVDFIDIGRMNGLLAIDLIRGRFFGHMRSLEILINRNLTAQEVRRVFNFGTAHAAGLTTSADISIDFNRVNGQEPICRAGTRQLTVRAFNNTVHDPIGTTYTDFMSL